jgi:hypothetical protein
MVWIGKVVVLPVELGLITDNTWQISYNLNSWHHKLATRAQDAVKAVFDNNPESFNTPEDIRQYMEFLLDEVAVKVGSNLNTAPYQWQSWQVVEDDEVQKSVRGMALLMGASAHHYFLYFKGFLMNQLILRTFSQHLVMINETTFCKDNPRPCGALIISMQVV